MNRSEIRYLLFQLQAKSQNDELDEPKLPNGFKESFESQSKYRGFANFGKTWDVGENDPWTVVSREKSLEEEWNEVLVAKVPEIQEDGTIYYPDETVKELVEGMK